LTSPSIFDRLTQVVQDDMLLVDGIAEHARRAAEVTA